MAYKLIGAKKLPYETGSDEILVAKEFLCDTDADLANLPECAPGSSAVSIESGTVKAVNTEGAWVPFAGSSSGGGTGSGGTGTLAYHVSSVDELPADAMDGSLAIVSLPSDLYGTWVFNDNPAIPNSSYSVNFVSNGVAYNTLTLYGSVYYGGPSNSMTVYNSSDGWVDDSYKTIRVTRVSYVSNILTYLTNNAMKIEDGFAYFLYSHENGEWVDKGELTEWIS